MQNVVECKVTGLDLLQRALEQKPRNIARRILRQVMRKAAKVWWAEMGRLAPKLSEVKLSTNGKYVRIPGDLARHIMMKVKANSDLEGSVRVGPVKRVFWGMFNEFGTRYMRPQPFIRPAYEAKKEEVLSVFIEEAKKVVAEEGKG